ncbi:threonine-phosphate decarboxylase [Candidatus Poribacteria bacterium]|nr:threonine-phosphate decarboxylase [Candidatus Poribacteria bacterium]
MINRTHGGNIRKYLNDKKTVIDFSANINPLGLPSQLKKIITKNFDILLHYPEPDSIHLKKVLSAYHNINSSNILIGNGSIELIYLIPRVLAMKKILVISPSFSEYEFAAQVNGMTLIFCNTTEKDNFEIDERKIAKLLPEAGMVFFCNPNNPTGYITPYEKILYLLNECKKNKTIFVIDEAFMDFVSNHEKLSFLKEAVNNKYLLVLRSLTKFFAIPSLRLGYLVGHKSLINKFSQFQYPWNINSLAQITGEEILKDTEYIQKSREFITKEKKYLFDNLKKIPGLKVFQPSVNFILCKLEKTKIKSASELEKKLIEYGIIIRNCNNFRGLNGNFFRVAVRKRKENNKLLLALKEILI